MADLAARLAARAGLFDACLAERLLVDPDFAGAARLAITVGGKGEVKDARLVAATFADPALEACLLDAALQIDFPAGVGGTSVLERSLVWPRDALTASE